MPWELNGNASTDANFIGTTNNNHLRFRTNNTQRMWLTNDGHLLWGSGNSGLVNDQGGSIELGGQPWSPGGGTPYIDFHFRTLAQDYNVRIINDADRQLTVVAAGGPGRAILRVSGDIRLQNADCAEDFDVSEPEEIEPGTVVVIDEEGAVRRSLQAYDTRVAGVISGAGGLKPGIILDKQESSDGRLPVALVGKVTCKADAQYSPIEVGDLLTTSPTPGHAMKATDLPKAVGAVLGKALQPLKEGPGIVPILVALQ